MRRCARQNGILGMTARAEAVRESTARAVVDDTSWITGVARTARAVCAQKGTPREGSRGVQRMGQRVTMVTIPHYPEQPCQIGRRTDWGNLEQRRVLTQIALLSVDKQIADAHARLEALDRLLTVLPNLTPFYAPRYRTARHHLCALAETREALRVRALMLGVEVAS